jgi:protoporphyrinogen oxidase
MAETTFVLGAGPAGLTAAYVLGKLGRKAVVLEAESQVGGLAKTVEIDGFRFDLGGHRFFTKAHEVEALWDEIMGDELLLRPRMSRIYWNNKFLDYPLRGPDVVRKLGPVELTRCVASYAKAAVSPKRDEESLEDWVSNRFGRRLFELFFKTYTEKVWGVPTTEIRAEWAAQRIRGLSFASAAKAAFLGNRGNKVKTLISEFRYPRYGPGQMWETMAQRIEAGGGEILLDTRVERLHLERGRVVALEAAGRTHRPDAVISSLALRDVVAMTRPRPPAEIVEAAHGLRYRDFLTVALVVSGDDLFPDNWIYIHDPSVRVGRIQNYRSWSPWMVPDPEKACVGLEYFCFAGDDLWSRGDDDLVDFAAGELERLGLARRGQVERGFAMRVPKAYPIYDADYAERVAVIRAWLETIDNLQQVGRNGLHRYNNSDHSMLTALRAVDNLVAGVGHDLWAVNADSAYHEESVAPEQPYRNAPETPELQASRG